MVKANIKRNKLQGPRRLRDLISIGPAMLRDFELLGIRSVEQLAKQNPQRLYEKLARKTKQHQDICVLDVFQAAVAQAKNTRLPAEQCQWWYWSRKRKEKK
jgi:nucleotidyltransferase/DNA polymerase involved in DNA repair